MEKIEKLKDGIELQVGFSPEMCFVLGAILRKQGEIIDRLNEQPVVKKNLTTEKSLEDTPEEWEEEIREVFDANTWFGNGIEEDGLDIQQEDALDMYESIRIIVKELLEEREREIRLKCLKYVLKDNQWLEKEINKLNK
jgi:hypothetical protein